MGRRERAERGDIAYSPRHGGVVTGKESSPTYQRLHSRVGTIQMRSKNKERKNDRQKGIEEMTGGELPHRERWRTPRKQRRRTEKDFDDGGIGNMAGGKRVNRENRLSDRNIFDINRIENYTLKKKITQARDTGRETSL